VVLQEMAWVVEQQMDASPLGASLDPHVGHSPTPYPFPLAHVS